MENSKKATYVLLSIIVITLVILVGYDLYTTKKIRENGSLIIAKFDSIEKTPKRNSYFFSYFIKGKKIVSANTGLKRSTVYYKSKLKPNAFYYAKSLNEFPNKIIVNPNTIILDSSAILNAGFSLEDLK